MKLNDLPDITFYSLANDKNAIFAEYTIPANNIAPRDLKKISPIDSIDFRGFLDLIVIPNNNGLSANGIINYVKNSCRLYGNEDLISPKVRTAGTLKSNLVEYALYDDEQNYIQVTAKGWYIVEDPVHKFIETPFNSSQILPKKSSEDLLTTLRRYVNTDKDSTILFTTWLVQSFCEGNHSALLISGEMGCGKSTLTKMVRRIIDPSKTGASIFPSKADDLLATLTNSYVATFDNTVALNDESYNIMCVAITGGTYTKRELYSTNSLATFVLHNTIVINGIDIIPSKSDFADRCLLLNLKRINKAKRSTEADILNKFDKDLPMILGGIFDTLAKAFSVISDLKTHNLPRMADSYLEMLAIAIALGIDGNDFERIYNENIESLNKARSNTDLVYAVQEYMEKHASGKKLEGTVSDVYNKIRNAAANKSAFPKSASHFSRKLKAEYSAFLAAGLIVNIDDTYADGTHLKIIKK